MVLVPSPLDSVHGAEVAKAMPAPKVTPSFENRIRVTPVASSVAASVNTTAACEVLAAPPLICRLPVGGVVSGGGEAKVMLAETEADQLPAPSWNCAKTVLAP